MLVWGGLMERPKNFSEYCVTQSFKSRFEKPFTFVVCNTSKTFTSYCRTERDLVDSSGSKNKNKGITSYFLALTSENIKQILNDYRNKPREKRKIASLSWYIKQSQNEVLPVKQTFKNSRTGWKAYCRPKINDIVLFYNMTDLLHSRSNVCYGFIWLSIIRSMLGR